MIMPFWSVVPDAVLFGKSEPLTVTSAFGALFPLAKVRTVIVPLPSSLTVTGTSCPAGTYTDDLPVSVVISSYAVTAYLPSGMTGSYWNFPSGPVVTVTGDWPPYMTVTLMPSPTGVFPSGSTTKPEMDPNVSLSMRSSNTDWPSPPRIPDFETSVGRKMFRAPTA